MSTNTDYKEKYLKYKKKYLDLKMGGGKTIGYTLTERELFANIMNFENSEQITIYRTIPETLFNKIYQKIVNKNGFKSYGNRTVEIISVNINDIREYIQTPNNEPSYNVFIKELNNLIEQYNNNNKINFGDIIYIMLIHKRIYPTKNKLNTKYIEEFDNYIRDKIKNNFTNNKKLDINNYTSRFYNTILHDSTPLLGDKLPLIIKI